ncbi:MAG: poly-gamma-glutamate hydrolase family protein [bacterium]|nr:poly-gamma-glutamate hydrolase family protein [bacterium]
MSEEIYKNFKELPAQKPGSFDYKIDFEDRGTDSVVIGIHGGEIEPGTEEVVRAISGSDLSYYLFLGGERTQHITSTHFDEENCVNLVSKSKNVISIHGKKGVEEFVMVGGLDNDLVSKIEIALKAAGFTILPASNGIGGIEPNNICNKGSSGKGLQLELSRGLRDSLIQDSEKMGRFSQIIRGLI